MCYNSAVTCWSACSVTVFWTLARILLVLSIPPVVAAVDWPPGLIPASFWNAPSRTAGWGALGHIPSLPCSPGCDHELDSHSWSWLAAAQRAPVQRALHSEGPGMVGLAAGLFQVLYWPLGARVGWCEPPSSMGSQLTLPASLVLKVGDLSVVACAPCLEQVQTQLPVAR